jgi:hypothetical protein
MAEPSIIPPASTFVVRFWFERSATAGRWRGRIEHVQSGEHIDFVDPERILAFVQGFGVMVPDQPSPCRAGKP